MITSVDFALNRNTTVGLPYSLNSDPRNVKRSSNKRCRSLLFHYIGTLWSHGFQLGGLGTEDRARTSFEELWNTVWHKKENVLQEHEYVTLRVHVPK